MLHSEIFVIVGYNFYSSFNPASPSLGFSRGGSKFEILQILNMGIAILGF